jgi:hypothetical protein
VRAGAAGVVAGAAVVALLRTGWLLQWPRAVLAGLLAAAAVTALRLLTLVDDLLAPGPWPAPPQPERRAGWSQLTLVTASVRKETGPPGGPPQTGSDRGGPP